MNSNEGCPVLLKAFCGANDGGKKVTSGVGLKLIVSPSQKPPQGISFGASDGSIRRRLCDPSWSCLDMVLLRQEFRPYLDEKGYMNVTGPEKQL